MTNCMYILYNIYKIINLIQGQRCCYYYDGNLLELYLQQTSFFFANVEENLDESCLQSGYMKSVLLRVVLRR